DTGDVADTIPRDRYQLDIGPETRRLFGTAIERHLKLTGFPGAGILFCNGSMGAFENDKFAEGTREITRLLSRLRRSLPAVEIFVGGGDGRLAFVRFGDVNAITHVFTCGGTVLKVIGHKNLNYVKSLYTYSRETPR